MNSLSVIFSIVIFLAGLFLGMSVELIVNSRTLNELKQENNHLRSELAKQPKAEVTEVIEIITDEDMQVKENDLFEPW